MTRNEKTLFKARKIEQTWKGGRGNRIEDEIVVDLYEFLHGILLQAEETHVSRGNVSGTFVTVHHRALVLLLHQQHIEHLPLNRMNTIDSG